MLFCVSNHNFVISELEGIIEPFWLGNVQTLLRLYSGYGISGYGVSRPGIQNKKGFCIKINLPKGNY